MRIDRYWKQAAAGLLAIMTLTMTGGNLEMCIRDRLFASG